MKQLITGLALLISSYSLVFGSEAKIGISIPDKRFFMDSSTWHKNGKNGIGDLYDINQDGKWDQAVVYLICKGEKSGYPFGVYDKSTKTLYLDNNPTDGFLDRIIHNPIGREVYEDAPDCP